MIKLTCAARFSRSFCSTVGERWRRRVRVPARDSVAVLFHGDRKGRAEVYVDGKTSRARAFCPFFGNQDLINDERNEDSQCHSDATMPARHKFNKMFHFRHVASVSFGCFERVPFLSGFLRTNDSWPLLGLCLDFYRTPATDFENTPKPPSLPGYRWIFEISRFALCSPVYSRFLRSLVFHSLNSIYLDTTDEHPALTELTQPIPSHDKTMSIFIVTIIYW